MVAGILVPAASFATSDADPDDSSTLFVLTAPSASSRAGTLTLEGVRSVIWFTDRPGRQAGHLDLADLAAIWESGSDSFLADPPNAVLSVRHAGRDTSVVVELTGIEVRGDEVTFTIAPIEGQLADGSYGDPALVIDDGGALIQLVAIGIQDDEDPGA